MMAAEPPPNVMAGKIKCEKPSSPDTGSKPSAIEKKRTSKGPNAKFGSDTPNKLTKPIARSRTRPRRIALITPNGTETVMEKIIDAAASFTVAGYRAIMAEATVS